MVPVDLITGFLGAGKTTFLQKYTDYLARQGIRFAVVENEFGAAGVDTAALQAGGQPHAVYELTGGCICCTLSGEIIGAVGTTAAAETAQGPHLHFGVTLDGEAVDPQEFLNS